MAAPRLGFTMSESAKNLEGGIYNWLLYFSHLWLTHLHLKITARLTGWKSGLCWGRGFASMPAAGGQGLLSGLAPLILRVMKSCREKRLS